MIPPPHAIITGLGHRCEERCLSTAAKGHDFGYFPGRADTFQQNIVLPCLEKRRIGCLYAGMERSIDRAGTSTNAGQCYPDYAFNHPPHTEGMRVYCDSKVSSFLSSITDGNTSSFLNRWNCERNHKERRNTSYDSTNKNCQAGDISIVEYGHPMDDRSLPVFNYAIVYDMINREPLFCEEYPGSIVDVSQLQFMLEKAKAYGYRKVGLLLDQGYFSKGNIDYMDDCCYDFIIMVKGRASLVGGLITQHKGSFENSRECSISSNKIYAKTVRARLFASDKKDRYHLYYSSARDSAEKEKVETRMNRMCV